VAYRVTDRVRVYFSFCFLMLLFSNNRCFAALCPSGIPSENCDIEANIMEQAPQQSAHLVRMHKEDACAAAPTAAV
jgi:hypothetical protein